MIYESVGDNVKGALAMHGATPTGNSKADLSGGAMRHGEADKAGRGLTILGAAAGLAAGAAAYGLVTQVPAIAADPSLSTAALIGPALFAGAWIFLAERGDLLRPLAPAAVVAGLLTVSAVSFAARAPLDAFAPALFWFAAFAPAAALLLLSLSKALLAPPGDRYTAFFLQATTAPLATLIAAATLSLAPLLAYAALSIAGRADAAVAAAAAQPAFALPLAGAAGGAALGFARGQRAVLGALRYAALLGCRIAAPATAALAVVIGGLAAFGGGAPAVLLIAVAALSFVAVNGVFQNGEGAPPGLWLRVACNLSLLAAPALAAGALYALWLRIGQYGATPPRLYGFAVASLLATYGTVAAAGVISELRFSGRGRWLPALRPINLAAAGIVAAGLLALGAPPLDPWTRSIDSQLALLLDGRAAVDAFDFAYLGDRLGEDGRDALAILKSVEDHPEAARIRAEAAAWLDRSRGEIEATPRLNDWPAREGGRTSSFGDAIENEPAQRAGAPTPTASDAILNLPLNPSLDARADAEPLDAPAENTPASDGSDVD